MSGLDPRIDDALARLPDYLGSHVLVSVSALALGLAVSLPLAILSIRRPILRNALLAFASTVQTALTGLSTIGSGNATVSGSNGGPWTVTFQRTLAGTNVQQLQGEAGPESL